MLVTGHLYYFTPFYFKNGHVSKPKYFIALYNDGTNNVIASLPTSSDRIPNSINVSHGCNLIEELRLSCYYFQNGKTITDQGFNFDRRTFVYTNSIDSYDLELLEDIYRVEGTDYQHLGKLIDSEFAALVSCLLSSNSVKRKFQNLLRTL
jgi:hypothetical protein